MLELGELLGVPFIETDMGFDLAPDGQRVAFSWNPTGNWEIYELALEREATLRLISKGPGAKFHPRYAPDGRRLAFSVDFDGSEKFHICLVDLERDAQTDLTPWVTCSLQANFSWSPDGKRIAFISDQTGQFDVYALDVDEKNHRENNSRLLLKAGFPAWKVRWSPDGKWLAVVVEASGIDYGTIVLPADGGDAFRISDRRGPIDAGQVSWSADSRRLAFSSDTQGFNNIGIFELAKRQITWLTAGKGEKQYPCWSPDGKRLAYVLNRGTVSWLAVQAPGECPLLYQVEPGVHYSPAFTRDGGHLIFGFDNPRHPTDLWRLAIDEGTFTQLTHSLPETFAGADFSMPKEVSYPGMDRTPVPALLFSAADQGPGPAVVLVHGGPDWFFEMTWYPVMAALASRGWVVLVPNYRGSTGYGRAWQEASRFDFGGVDTDDVAAGVRYLVDKKLADPNRIGITGRSHGGFLTASCLTRYPDLWAVGSAVVPFLNWFTNHAEIRPDLQQWDYENFGDPEKDRDRWHDRSPGFFLDRVRAPLQLICGRLDARCPVSDSIQAEKDMKSMGKTVELLMYEDEGHIFLKQENILDAELRRLAFLAKYLGEKESGEEK
ncbi:MAG TPA: S9 family peptidase [Anaerolineales bacterium]|nr:S9 family peptidase [Anaerolineales bacterium]